MPLRRLAFASSPRRVAAAGLALWACFALVSVSGCASLGQVSSEVTSYGAWPAGRAPASFAFDRLPSQSAQSEGQDRIEAAALPALLAAGFTPAAPGSTPDVLVMIGARIERQDRSPWDDPLWIRPWGPSWRYSPWGSPFWPDPLLRRPDFQREVALLIRDRASGAALYETRANNTGVTEGGQRTLSAMFSAALKEFPVVASSPHPVSAPLPPAP
jgi:hypothetical protein